MIDAVVNFVSAVATENAGLVMTGVAALGGLTVLVHLMPLLTVEPAAKPEINATPALAPIEGNIGPDDEEVKAAVDAVMLAEILDARRAGFGFSKISRDLGIPLGKVIDLLDDARFCPVAFRHLNRLAAEANQGA